MTKNLDQKEQELEETLRVMWDEAKEEALAFVATLSRLHRAEKNSDEYDAEWGELATILSILKLKITDASKLMEKLEALEARKVKS